MCTDSDRPSGGQVTLIGRDDDLELIDAVLAFAEPAGNALLLLGEPGVGKTALLDAAARRANGRVLRAAGSQFEAELSYAGLNQLLMPLQPTLRRLGAAHRWALRVALGLGEGPPPDRLLVCNATLALLRTAAAHQGVTLIIDDLQWVDRASAGVLAFVARRINGSRVGFLAAVRLTGEGFFERTGLPGHEISPLTEHAAAELLATRFPTAAARTRQRILAVARGNPLALLELPVALTDRQLAADEPLPTALPLSRRLQSVFTARVDQLPTATRDLLLIAAVDATGDLGLLHDAGTPLALPDLVPAEDARLIRLDTVTGRLTFRHPLIRSAMVDVASSSDRRHAHKIIADRSTDHPERRAWHLAEATVEPDEDVARQLQDAARQVLRRGDAVGAVTMLLRAAELSPDPAVRSRRMAHAAYIGADVTGDLRHLEQLLDDARRDPELSGSLGTAVAAAYLLLNRDSDVDTAHRLLVGALQSRAGPFDAADDILVEALHTLLMICFFGGRVELWEPFDRALGRLTPSPPELLAILSGTFADPLHQAIPTLRRLDDAIAGLADEVDPVRIVRIGIAAVYVDRLSGCREALWRVAEDGRQGGAVTSAIDALFLLGVEAFTTGRWDECQELNREGLTLCDSRGYQILAWPGRYGQALIAAASADYPTVDALTERMIEWAAPRGLGAVLMYAHHARDLAALGRGDFETAYQEATAVSPAGVLRSHLPQALWLVMDVVESAVRTGRHREAAAHAAVAAGSGIAAISSRLGLLTAGAIAAAAAPGQASSLFEQALAIPQVERWPFDVARVHLLYGEHLRRAKASGAARTHLAAARAIFERLNAEPWTARAGLELRAAGLGVTTSARLAPLTAQERQIAMLAAGGLTNRQIGERLYLSHRTVGAHLYQIFPKLGITTRAALRDALGTEPADAPPAADTP